MQGSMLVEEKPALCQGSDVCVDSIGSCVKCTLGFIWEMTLALGVCRLCLEVCRECREAG